MWVSLPHDRAHDFGRLDRFMCGVPAVAVHEIQDPPLDRLEPIPGIGYGPRIRRHPVLRIRVLNRRRKFLLPDLLGLKSHQRSAISGQPSAVSFCVNEASIFFTSVTSSVRIAYRE